MGIQSKLGRMMKTAIWDLKLVTLTQNGILVELHINTGAKQEG